jgi:hypothetical protein
MRLTETEAELARRRVAATLLKNIGRGPYSPGHYASSQYLQQFTLGVGDELKPCLHSELYTLWGLYSMLIRYFCLAVGPLNLLVCYVLRKIST